MSIPPTTLYDDDLALRPWAPGDADTVFRACQDSEILRWTTLPSPYTREDARRWVDEIVPAGWASSAECAFAVVADGVVVAAVGLRPAQSRANGRTGEVGYWAAPWGRGRGHVTRAVRLLCGWGFDTLGLARIDWEAEVGNARSRAVAERCGFRVEGVGRGRLHHRGARVDGWFGGLLPDDPREGTPTEPLWPARLETDRLLLRPLEPADAGPVAAGCADATVLRWIMSMPSPYTLADGEDFVRAQAGAPWRGTANHAVVERSTDRLVGVIGIFDHDRRRASAEIGYWLATAARGRGYATEAVTALARWGFGVVGLHRIELSADAENLASCRVAEKAGFVREGVRREAGVNRSGERRDMVLHALLAPGTAPR